jgi:hypothetical protein
MCKRAAVGDEDVDPNVYQVGFEFSTDKSCSAGSVSLQSGGRRMGADRESETIVGVKTVVSSFLCNASPWVRIIAYRMGLAMEEISLVNGLTDGAAMSFSKTSGGPLLPRGLEAVTTRVMSCLVLGISIGGVPSFVRGMV